jgi:hypothetical protein
MEPLTLPLTLSLPLPLPLALPLPLPLPLLLPGDGLGEAAEEFVVESELAKGGVTGVVGIVTAACVFTGAGVVVFTGAGVVVFTGAGVVGGVTIVEAKDGVVEDNPLPL